MPEGGDFRAAAREAWIYLLPLIELAGVRSRACQRGAALNRFHHSRQLSDPRSRAVTAPNNDTLYSNAYIDLAAGPVTIALPDAGARYISLQLMDAFTNSFAVLGTRGSGPRGTTFQLIGPDEAAPAAQHLRAPTRHVWALARVLVDGPSDLEAARATQDGVTLQGPAAVDIGLAATRSAPWADYFAAADGLLSRDRPPLTDLAVLRRIAPLCLGEGGFDAARFSAAEVAEIEAGVAEARGGLFAGQRPRIVDGWSYPRPELGDFGLNHAYRAAIAVGGLAALPPVEAMVMRAAGQPGGLYDGAKNWRLSFPAGRTPPVRAFWSLSVYEATPEGQFFFAENPIGRYAIGDRTEGLAFGADGSLDLWIGHETPAPQRASNWLPTPAGPFALFFRAYLPSQAMLDGAWRLPPIIPAEGPTP